MEVKWTRHRLIWSPTVFLIFFKGLTTLRDAILTIITICYNYFAPAKVELFLHHFEAKQEIQVPNTCDWSSRFLTYVRNDNYGNYDTASLCMGWKVQIFVNVFRGDVVFVTMFFNWNKFRSWFSSVNNSIIIVYNYRIIYRDRFLNELKKLSFSGV